MHVRLGWPEAKAPQIDWLAVRSLSLAGPCRGPLVGDRVRIAGSDWVSVHMSVELARRGVDVVPLLRTASIDYDVGALCR